MPLSGIGKILSKGFELKRIKTRKNNNKTPIIEIISITILFGIFPENKGIHADHKDKIKTHNSIEPSCAPHTAENL